MHTTELEDPGDDEPSIDVLEGGPPSMEKEAPSDEESDHRRPELDAEYDVWARFTDPDRQEALRDVMVKRRTVAPEVLVRLCCLAHQHGDRFQKTIVFCVDEEHGARMRQALINENKDLCDENHRYVMRITGSDGEGQAQLGNFIDPESRYPVSPSQGRLHCTGRNLLMNSLVLRHGLPLLPRKLGFVKGVQEKILDAGGRIDRGCKTMPPVP